MYRLPALARLLPPRLFEARARVAIAFLAAVLLSPAQPVCAGIQLIDTVNLRERQARPLDENVLKLHGAAVDAARNRVYVAGILSPALAVLDGGSEAWLRTYDTGIGGFALKYLAIDSVANRLYINDATGNTLRAIDLASGARIGPVSVPSTLARPTADSRRGMVYMTFPDTPSFRAYNGADLSLAYASDAMGAGAAQALWDEATDRVHVLDAATPGVMRIHHFDPAARAVSGTLTLPLGPGQRPYRMALDPVRQRFFVAAGPQVLAASADAGLLCRMPLSPAQDTQDIAFDPARNEVAVLVLDRPAGGTQAESGGHVLVFNAATCLLTRDLALSRKPHTLNYNSANGRYYLPESDASVVWSVSGGGGEARGLRLGDSAEMLALAHDGESLFLTSRLGGSYLMEWRTSTSSLRTFSAGFWPVPIRVAEGGYALHVLNAWDSTLAVFDLADSRWSAATIPLGLPTGTTDRLPDLALDPVRQRAYAAYPEFGQIAVVDLIRRAPLAPISVPGFPTGDTGGGPGQLQVRVVTATGRLFAYWQPAKRITVWDVTGDAPVLLLDRSLGGMPAIGASLDQLFVDGGRNRVYAGPMELDGATGQPTGRLLGHGERVIGLDEHSNSLWTSAVAATGGVATDVVARLDRDSLAAWEILTLGAAPSVMSTQYAFDAARQRLYAADGQEALLRVYNTAPVPVPARVAAVEFFHRDLDHYFMTADAVAARSIDRGAAGAGWTRTGDAFYVHPADGAPAGARPVCRFYGTPGAGPNTHLFTADPQECAARRADRSWQYEGIAFAISLPVAGACAPATQPVYRAASGGGAQVGGNDRYSADPGIYARMIGQGWLGAGIAFCAPR